MRKPLSRISSYLMGSGENLEIQTDITNNGEDAFNALLEVQIPQGVSYVNANTGTSGISIMCSPPSARDVLNNVLVIGHVSHLEDVFGILAIHTYFPIFFFSKTFNIFSKYFFFLLNI